MLAVVTGTLVLASACSDGGGTPPPDNTAPVGAFSEVCTNLTCVFTDASTDPDGNTDITTRTWTFGDGTTGAGTSVAHAYAGANTYTVVLRVTDNGGLSNEVSRSVAVTAPPPGNQAPVAGFTFAVTDNSVAFTNTSTDADGTIAYLWNFGEPTSDPNNESTLEDPTHTYTVTAPAPFTVTLTVTDDDGATDVETQTVTVSPPNTPPTAGFTHTCTAATCRFTSTSTDVAPGTIATYAWDFGDGATADVANPSRSYALVNPTDFTVTLTVTDNEGATDVETQTITVAPPPPGAEGCTTSGTRVECRLDISAPSNIKLKLIGISCNLDGNRITIPPPSRDQVFLNVCARAVGDSTKIFGGPGDSAFLYETGSQVRLWFDQGTPRRGQPAVGTPAGQVVGSFPNWTINFEDGARPGDAGEPDFADVVLQVEAIPARQP
jgi:PKD repeat protein